MNSQKILKIILAFVVIVVLIFRALMSDGIWNIVDLIIATIVGYFLCDVYNKEKQRVALKGKLKKIGKEILSIEVIIK